MIAFVGIIVRSLSVENIYYGEEVASLITAINHITFIVKDLKKTALFLKKIFEAEEVYSSSSVKYFLVNDLWIALNKGEPLPERTYNHIAFTIHDSDYAEYIKRIKDVGAEILQGRTRRDGEGRSIYFYDFDNHLFELHTGSLSERLTRHNQDDEDM